LWYINLYLFVNLIMYFIFNLQNKKKNLKTDDLFLIYQHMLKKIKNIQKKVEFVILKNF